MAQSAAVERGQQKLAQLAQPEKFKKFQSPLFDGGIRTDKNPSGLAPNELSTSQNLKVLAGRLVADGGYSPLGPVVPGPQVAYQVFYPNGTDDLLLITLTTVYRFNQTVDQWQYVTWGETYETAAASAAGVSTFQLVSVAGISVGSSVGIELDGGVELQTTVLTIAGSSIITADAVPVGGNVSLGATISLAATLHGTYDIQVSTEEFVDGAVYITNGVDPVFFFKDLVLAPIPSGGTVVAATSTAGAGNVLTFASVPAGVAVNDVVVDQTNPAAINTAAQVVSLTGTTVTLNNSVASVASGDSIAFTSSGLPVGTTCQWILTFHEQLYLFNTIEGGQAFPQRVRASDQANAALWLPTALGGPGGLQEIYDLNDTEDFILTAAILGPWMIVYRETTIMRASYLGLLNETLLWEYMIYGEGAQSQGAVSPIGDAHLVVGTSGVYLYRGDYTLESIGEAVFIGFLSAIGKLNPTLKNQLFTQYIGDYDEVWMLYPVVGSQALPFNNLIVELDNNGWFPRQYPNQFASCAPYLPLQDTTWATAPGTWADYTRPWNSRVFTKNVPNMLLCSPDAQRVMIYDYTTQTDNGQVIEWEAETGDWQDRGYLFRTDSIRLYGRGNGVLLEYAVDGSDDQFDAPPDFTTIGTINFGDRQRMQILTFQIVADHIRFRISGNDPNFALLWFECWYLEESEW